MVLNASSSLVEEEEGEEEAVCKSVVTASQASADSLGGLSQAKRKETTDEWESEEERAGGVPISPPSSPSPSLDFLPVTSALERSNTLLVSW